MQKDKDDLPVIAGHRLDGTLEAHMQSCRVLIGVEQAKPAPDNAIISVLCDSVRLAREYARMATKRREDA